MTSCAVCLLALAIASAHPSALGYKSGSVSEMFDTIRNRAYNDLNTHFAILDLDSDGMLNRHELKDGQSNKWETTEAIKHDEETYDITRFAVAQTLSSYKPPKSKKWPGLSLQQLRELWSNHQLTNIGPRLEDFDDQTTPMDDVCFPDPQSSNGFGSNGKLWEGDPVPAGLKGRCDLAQEDNTIDAATFKAKYVDKRIPVLIRNMTSDWPASTLWNDASQLAALYPDLKMWVGYGHDPSDGGTQMSLKQFLDSSALNESIAGDRPPYLNDNGWNGVRYDTMNEQRGRHPLEDSKFPAILDALPEATRIIGMHFTAGGGCTGTHIHEHSHAWCALIGGLKWWGIADTHGSFEAPDELEDFHYHARDYLNHLKMGSSTPWYEQRYDGMLECVQGKGDFLYIPEGFHHVVLNVWPSVGVAHEFVLPNQQREEELEVKQQMDLADARKSARDAAEATAQQETGARQTAAWASEQQAAMELAKGRQEL